MTDFIGRSVGSEGTPEGLPGDYFIGPKIPGTSEVTIYHFGGAEDGGPEAVMDAHMVLPDDRTDPWTPEQLGQVLSDQEIVDILPRTESGRVVLPEPKEHVTARPPLEVISHGAAVRLVGALGIERPEVRAEANRKKQLAPSAGHTAIGPRTSLF